MKRRFWAGLLSFVMLWSLLPASALATEEGTPEPGKVTATKTASTLNNDGTYTITLTVQGNPVEDKETTTTSANADVVLVVDNSGSMASSVGEKCTATEFTKVRDYKFLLFWTWETYKCAECGATYFKIVGNLTHDTWYTNIPKQCTGEKGVTPRIDAAKNVGKEFAKSILEENSGNRLAVIGFAHSDRDGGTDPDAIKVSQDLTNNLTTVNGALDKMDADGGTNYTAALQKAYDFLNDRTQEEKTSRPGYVIFISDGTPGLSGDSQDDTEWNGADQVKSIKKDGYTLYTVGIALDNTAADYLKSMASDAQNDHFINVTDTNYDQQLSTILKQWAVKITETTKKKPAGTNATLVDLINTDKFDYVDGSASENLKVEEDNKTVTWTIDKIPEKPESATFQIKAKAGVYGKDIPTNDGDATLTYIDAKEKTGEIKLPSPKVDIENQQYTVTYHANNGVTPEVTYTDTVTAGSSTTVRGAAADVGTFSVTLPNDIPFEYPGKEFKGWAETPDGAVKYAPGKEISNIVTNYNLYAVWDDSAVTETKYQLVYFAGSSGFLPGETAQYATSKADPKMYDKGAKAPVKYDDADFAITVTADQTLFIGWTEDSESVGKIYKLRDEVPTLETEVEMTGDKAVYAVYGEDANEDGTPDVYQAKVTYEVVNGWWTDNGTTVLPNKEIVAWFNLYQKVGNTWKIVTPAPKLGDTVPKGRSGQPGYTGAGWFMDKSKTVMENGPDSTTQVTKPETLYTFKYEDATHKYDVYDVLNSLVYKDFQSRYGENTTAEFTVTATMRAGTLLPLPDTEEVKPEGTEITGKVSISTKDQPKAFVFERPLGYMNPEDGDYFVEVTETDDGTANVTFDHRTFRIAFCIKDGAVDQKNIQISYFADNELTPAENATFVNTYTKKTTSRDDDSDTYYYVVKKVDAQDGHALKDAKFGLYADDEQIATATSSSKGYARFSLDERVYKKLVKNDDLYVMELTAPDGYVKSSRKYDVSVNAFVKNNVLGAQEHAITVTNSRSSTPDRLNDEEHFAYVIGYKDGNVRPYGLISRAETTTIFFRLLKDSVRDGNLLTSNTYTDVADSYWANTAISTMTGLGIVQGRTATTFDPYAPITRAQFAAICARFDDGKTQGGQTFTDIQGHWAQAYIERAAELGWIKGFEDGTFRPDTYITRAQAMTMINRVLNRIPEDADDLLSNMNVWPDCNPGDWFYLAVQEATNSHDYKHKAGNYETWSSMNKDPDWTRYEN